MINEFKKTLNRSFTLFNAYPQTLIFSLIATSLGIYVNDEKHFDLIRLGFTCGISIAIFYGIETSRRVDLKVHYFVRVLLGYLIVALIYFFIIPDDPDFDVSKRIQVLVVIVCSHLWVSIAPFIFSKNSESFWHYNKHLFLGIFTAFLYTMSLFLGLLVALLAIKNLFNVDIAGTTFKNLFLITNVFANTFIFIGKSPDLDNMDKDYPKTLKYFVLYVLLPLLLVYLCILLAYQGKIILQWSLPKGYVSIMVLVSGIFGILAFLLLHPLKQMSSWIEKFNKWYYWVLLWLVFLLLVSIYVRVNQYGLSDARYYVALLGLWLLAICMYFIISKKDDISIIPKSLLIVLLLTLFGPQSPATLSISNQKNRLGSVLKKDRKKLSAADLDKLYASVEYLSSNNPDAFSGYLSTKDFDDIKKLGKGELEVQVLKRLKVPEKTYNGIDQKNYFTSQQEVLDLHRSDYLVNFNMSDSLVHEIVLPNKDTLMLSSNAESVIFKISNDNIIFKLSDIFSQSPGSKTNKEMSFAGQSAMWDYEILINDANLNPENRYYVNGKIMLKKR